MTITMTAMIMTTMMIIMMVMMIIIDNLFHYTALTNTMTNINDDIIIMNVHRNALSLQYNM